MPHPYAQTYALPFPQLPVVLIHPESNAHSASLPRLLDTGADATLVPIALLRAVGAEEIYRASLRSHWGESRPAVVYLVDLQVAGHSLPGIEVIADEQFDAILLGRNVLNRLILVLDGPVQEAEVLTARRRRRQ
jgi:predicted aspartyl protease